MTESEPSAPLPDAHAGCKPALYDNALDAAIERAERAERERDDAFERADGWHFGHEVWKGRALAAETDLDQARAQLAKVRAIHYPVRVGSGGSSTTDREGNHRSTVTWATACSCTRNWEVRCATLAALDPVGATEDEAKP